LQRLEPDKIVKLLPCQFESHRIDLVDSASRLDAGMDPATISSIGRALPQNPGSRKRRRAQALRLRRSACREREVMALVVSGLMNKQVGGELGISEITVKARRGQMMQKMKAKSLVDLVNMAARLRLPHAPKR
jgi:DNA-binding NarL/FixJ family response regulator